MARKTKATWVIGETKEIMEYEGNGDILGWITHVGRGKWEVRTDPDQDIPLPMFTTLKAAMAEIDRNY